MPLPRPGNPAKSRKLRLERSRRPLRSLHVRPRRAPQPPGSVLRAVRPRFRLRRARAPARGRARLDAVLPHIRLAAVPVLQADRRQAPGAACELALRRGDDADHLLRLRALVCGRMWHTRWDMPQGVMQGVAGSYSNIGYMGPPLVLSALGPGA